MIEDPLYLSKDTKVFIIFDSEDLDDVHSKNRAVNEFNKWGYTCSSQRLLDIKTINNSDIELGFDSINVSSQYLSSLEIRQWYTFINILRKARILGKPFMVVFTGIGRFSTDFPKSYETIPINIFDLGRGVCMSTTQADEILKLIFNKDNITVSVKQYLRLLMMALKQDETPL